MMLFRFADSLRTINPISSRFGFALDAVQLFLLLKILQVNKSSLLFMLLFVFTVSRIIAQGEEMSADEQTTYPKTITTRAEKLVTLPGIADFSRVNADGDVIVYQYRSLNAIYKKRNNQSNAPLKQHISGKSTLYSSVQELEANQRNAYEASR